MNRINIGINYAIMIERVRSAGVENNQLIQLLKDENIEFLSKIGNGLPDWETLINLFKSNIEDFKKILEDGYQIKFLTKGSLMTLLRLKYGIEVEKDYEDKGTAIEGILLAEKAIEELKNTLAINWKLISYIDEKDQTAKVRIELIKGSEVAVL
jgi:hypothetical protein